LLRIQGSLNIFIASNGTVAGWGGTPQFSVLMKDEIPIVSHEECGIAYGSKDWGIFAGMICAGTGEECVVNILVSKQFFQKLDQCHVDV